MAKLIDLTHVLEAGLPVYPGDTSPTFEQKGSLDKEGCINTTISSTVHAGTHIDAPSHVLLNGKKISEYPLEKFIGTGITLDARGKSAIDASLLIGKNISVGDIVIVITGWYKKFGEVNYYSDAPLITLDFAEQLAKLKISMLGLDTPSPDVSPFEIHKILLAEEILIIENLNNTESLLGEKNFEVIALPLNIQADGSPVRVIARIL